MNREHYKKLPSLSLTASLSGYIEFGHDVGGFLTAVLENDLRGSIERDDSVYAGRVADIVRWLYTYAPAPCWGSPAKVRAWSNHDGLAGMPS